MTDPRRPGTPRPRTPWHPYDGDASSPAPGWTRIAPQTGALVELAAGQVLEIVDPCGEQVSDFYAAMRDDVEECFSASRSVDYNNTLYVCTGDTLWSNRSHPMATIVEDSIGVHDMTVTPCSQQAFDILYPQFEGAPHPSCFANLCEALEPVGVSPDRIGTTLNIFMDVWTDADGELHIDPPPHPCRGSRCDPGRSRPVRRAHRVLGGEIQQRHVQTHRLPRRDARGLSLNPRAGAGRGLRVDCVAARDGEVWRRARDQVPSGVRIDDVFIV